MRNLTPATIGEYAEIIKRNGLKMSIMDDNLIHNANALLALEGRLCTITEAQRQGAQKLAAGLRQRVEKHRRHALLSDDLHSHGVHDAMGHVGIWLDELCPPVICDDPASPEPLPVADYVTVE